MPEVPRPDQRAITGPPGGPGSRSGAGDLAGALGYPGISPAIPNCQGASKLHAGVGTYTLFTFPAAGRLWIVSLSYVIVSNPSFVLATAKTFATVATSPGGIVLAGVDLAVGGAGQHAEGQSEPGLASLPVTQGQSLMLSVNGGTLVANLDQQASAIVLYSIP